MNPQVSTNTMSAATPPPPAPSESSTVSEEQPRDLTPEERARTLVISVSAAEAIQGQRAKRGTPDAAIRVGIRGGG